MSLLNELATQPSIAHTVLVLAVVATAGLSLGSLKYRGISLGVAGVLFVGILLGYCKVTIPETTLDFVRDFGLILFVYTIGMQVGPSFLSSLRQKGLVLNSMALAIVLLGAVLTVGISYLLRDGMAAAVGLFAGATTNTPALGAAQEALKGAAADKAGYPALGYAVAYPFGILGVIIAMIAIRTFFRINVQEEVEILSREQTAGQERPHRMNLVVENPNLEGLKLREIPGSEELGIVVSRVRKVGETEPQTASPDTVIHRGDIILAVGKPNALERYKLIVGRESHVDLLQVPGRVRHRRLVVTNKAILGKSLRELDLPAVCGVIVSRVTRADIEMTAVPALQLQFGDMLQVVGDEESLDKAAKLIGNSVKELSHTNLIPIFIGIALGVLVGLYPFKVGNIPVPVRLGLAGGPLVVAILLSRIGRIGPLVWHMPVNANILLRELGIVLFLTCVGLRAGEKYFEVLFSADGCLWLACGVAITLLPILVVAFIGRRFLKLNFVHLCGVLAGSMTDPPALAFANSFNNSDAPSVAYATVYPLTMILRIIVAQLLVLFWLR